MCLVLPDVVAHAIEHGKSNLLILLAFVCEFQETKCLSELEQFEFR